MISFYQSLAISVTIITHSQSTNITTEPNLSLYNATSANWIDWTFKDYLQKFNPTRVWEEISKENAKRGLKKDVGEEFEAVYKGIDETDELLSLKVSNGDPKVIMKDGRRWEPPGDIVKYTYDRFSLNRRFLELMKQSIYQARNKMAIMQEIRPRYNKKSLYKMGFLMSKTDQACKTFARFAFKVFTGCFHTRLRHTGWPLLEIMEGYERLINLWFDVELLVDLIIKNNDNCERMLNQVLTNRKEAWKFVD